MRAAPLALFAVTALAGLAPAGATSASPAGQARPAPVETGSQTLAPLAFVAFCRRNPAECAADTRPPPALTAARKTQLDEVHKRVNGMITSRPGPIDEETEWRIAPREGNCNDYAVTKRHLLIRAGWPPSALLLARVRTIAPTVDHLVLVVKTQEDSYVLDNLQSEVKPKQERAYKWLKRQSTTDPNVWVWGS